MISILNSKSLVSIQNGKVTTTSNVVATAFCKRHDHVLRSIGNLISEVGDDFAAPNFGASEYIDSTGRKLPSYEITRDGFTLLAMGFTGKKALQFKLAYIDAFNTMEAELLRISNQSRAPYSVNPTDTLSASEAEELRMTLKSCCERLPREKQATFMVKGWSRLKSHFGVNYRQIPKGEYSEALSLVTRYAAEWELVNAPESKEVLTSSAKLYSYPIDLLMQKFFCGTNDDGGLRLPKLDLRMMGNPRFESSIAKLLKEMHMDGHSVDAPYAEYMAIKRGLELLDEQLTALFNIGSTPCNSTLKALCRE